MTPKDVSTFASPASRPWLRSEVCLILSATAVGFAALWNDGFLSAWGMLCLLAAAITGLIALVDTVGPRGQRPAGLWKWLVGVALLAQIAINTFVYPGARWSARNEDLHKLGQAWADLGWSYSPDTLLSALLDVVTQETAVSDPFNIAGMAVVGLLAVLAASRAALLGRIAFVAVVLVYGVVGAHRLRIVPDPPIDTFVSQQAACKALLAGQNPYTTKIPDIYGKRATSYPAWLVEDGVVQIGFFYPPYSLLLALPGYALAGDHRYSQLAALLLSALLVGFSVSNRKARIAALVILLNPRNLMYVELGFTDHFVLLGIASLFFAAVREWRLTGVLLGLLIATKPYMALMLPLVTLMEGSRRWMLRQALLSAVLVTTPIALWNISAFLKGCVFVHLQSPFRKDSLSLPAFFVSIGVDSQLMEIVSRFGYAVAILAIILCLVMFRRGTRSFAMANAASLFAFFMTTKQSFGNYLLPVIGFLGTAAATRFTETLVLEPEVRSGIPGPWDRFALRIYRRSWLPEMGRSRLPAIASLSVGLWALMLANDLHDGFFCPPAILWLTISIIAIFLAVDLANPAEVPKKAVHEGLETDAIETQASNGTDVSPTSFWQPLRASVRLVHVLADFLRRHPLIPALIPLLAAGHLYWRFLDGYPGSHWCSPTGSTVRELAVQCGKLLWELDPVKRHGMIQRIAELEGQVRDPRFIWAFLTVGGLALLTAVGSRRVAAFAFPAAVTAYALTGIYWINQHPNPSNTDAFVLQQDACAALLRGEKPYSITIPLVFDPGVQPYAPELVKDGRVLFGYTYPPVMLFLNLPAYVLSGDHRHAEMLSLAIAAALMGYIRPGRFPKIVGLFYLFCPRAFMVVEVSWTDPIVGMLIALTVFCAVRFPKATPYVFGVLVAVKQYTLFYIPLAVLLVPSGKLKDIFVFLVKAGITSAVLSLPLALLDWKGFVHSAIRLQFMQDWYRGSLGYMGALWWAGVPVQVLHSLKMLPFLLAVAFTVYAIMKLPRTPGAFALGICVVYVVFVAFNKQAFLNYYMMVFAAGCCALACGDFVRPRRPAVTSLPDERERMEDATGGAVPRGLLRPQLQLDSLV